jgi:hypothetical protein
MTVTYKHESGNTIICHGTGHRGEPDYFTGPLGDQDSTVMEWVAQVSRPIRAKSAKPLDRANGIFAFALAVERRFASEDKARVFEMTFGGTLPRGNASLEISDIAPHPPIIMAHAVLTRLAVNRIGLSCDFHFEFQTSIPTTETTP